MSNIEWTDITWNPGTGCTKISPGCKNCYADDDAKRMQQQFKMGVKKFHAYKNGFKPTMHLDRIQKPKKVKTPSMIFVNSMSDLLHEDFPDWFIRLVFKTMNECPHHIFQVLTKRPERLLRMAKELSFTENIWIGVSVEDNERMHRIETLRKIPSAIRFVSFEPLLELLSKPNMAGVHWAIIGGESPGARGRMRLCEINWIDSLCTYCDEQGVAVFVKQLGGVQGIRLGMMKDGKFDTKGGDFSLFPEHLQRREYPIDVTKYQQ